MKKYTARTSCGSSDMSQIRTDDIKHAVAFLGDCSGCVGTVYRNSTSRAIYQIEHGKLNFDRRLKKEK